MARALPVFVIGALVGAIGGFLALQALERGAEEAPRADGDSEALAGELRGLRMEMGELRAALGAAPRRVEPAVSAAPLVDPRLDDVAARLEGLEAALMELTPRLEAAAAAVQGMEGVMPVQSVADRMPEALPERPADVGRLEALRGLGMDELTDRHVLWTYEQVGEAYGRPTRMRPSSGGRGIKYQYEMPDGEVLYFWFVDGKVVGAFW